MPPSKQNLNALEVPSNGHGEPTDKYTGKTGAEIFHDLMIEHGVEAISAQVETKGVEKGEDKLKLWLDALREHAIAVNATWAAPSRPEGSDRERGP